MLQEIDIDRCIEVAGKKVPVYDVTHGGFTPSVNNVTRENVAGAGVCAGDMADKITTIVVRPELFFALKMNHHIERTIEGDVFCGELFIRSDKTLPKKNYVLDSHLCDAQGEVLAVLRTREY